MLLTNIIITSEHVFIIVCFKMNTMGFFFPADKMSSSVGRYYAGANRGVGSGAGHHELRASIARGAAGVDVPPYALQPQHIHPYDLARHLLSSNGAAVNKLIGG